MFEKEIAGAWMNLKLKKPLIHCITNPISINDCANIVLAAGARPIMAEHPEEAAEITEHSDALAVNLGNITDARMESMKISGITAKLKGINVVIDIVGTACSSLRLNYANEYIETVRPSVIKGNISELMALGGLESFACGIDAGDKDAALPPEQVTPWLSELALRLDAVVMATGKNDYITDGKEIYMVSNGSPRMAQITGTGCMLNALTGSLLPAAKPIKAAITAASVFGLSGEMADLGQGLASYHIALIDTVSMITSEQIINGVRIERIK